MISERKMGTPARLMAPVSVKSDQPTIKATSPQATGWYCESLIQKPSQAIGDRQAAMAKVIDMRKKLDGEFVAKLDEKQKSRLTGIMVQVVGASSLMDAEVQTVLGVTDDQKKALAEAQTKNREATRESMQGLRDLSPEERNEQMAKMRTESDKVLLAVLTEEQKSKMEALKGAELKVDVSSLRGRGGPGGRPRRDN